MKQILAGCLLLFSPLVFLTAQAAPAAIEETALKAQSMNLEIIKARREVRDAEKELKGEIHLKNSSISIGGGYKYLSPAAQTSFPNLQGGFSGSLGITLPFVPQASLSGEVEVQEDGAFEETISLSLKPFLTKDCAATSMIR